MIDSEDEWKSIGWEGRRPKILKISIIFFYIYIYILNVKRKRDFNCPVLSHPLQQGNSL